MENKFSSELLVNNIRVLCETNKMSVSDLEHQLGLSAGYISRCYSKSKRMSIDVVIAISEKFKVAIDDLLYVEMESAKDHYKNLIKENINKLDDLCMKVTDDKLAHDLLWYLTELESAIKGLEEC